MIGQPESYGDILRRVFYSTLGIGLACTLALAHASTELKAVFDLISLNVDLSFVQMKLLYVLLPTVVGFGSRIVKLHDRVSDLLHLRRTIDIEWVLLPMAERTLSELDDAKRLAIRFRRRRAMYQTFYKHVSLPDSAIDRQLVRTALDAYGWLWCGLEGLVLLVPTALALWFLDDRALAFVVSATVAAVGILVRCQWFVCKVATVAEVDAILDDLERRREIGAYLRDI